MQWSINLESVFRGFSMADAFIAMQRLGYDTFERWVLTEKEIAPMQRRMRAAHLRLSAFCTDFFTLNDPLQRNIYLTALRQAIRKAGSLGCSKLITQVGQDTGAPREQQHDAIVEGLREAAPVLEKAGIVLLVEPLNTVRDHPGYYLTDSDEGFEIIREVGSNNVRLLFDVYHQLQMGEDVYALIEHNAPLIGHYHIAGYPNRDQHLFSGYDYTRLLKLLDRVCDPTIYVGLECFPDSTDEAIAILKRLKAFEEVNA